MKSFRDRNPYLVGLASVAFIATAVGFAFLVGILRLFEDTYEVSAVFSDAAGIREGDDVRVAGVKAGRVTGVRADRVHGTVIVDMAVNAGVDLGAGTRAEIALETLLGTKYVRLSGPVAEPYLESLPAERREIPIERTQTPFEVFEIAKVGTRSIQQTDTEKLNKLITQLADVSEGKHEQVSQLVNGIAEVSAAINERDTQLRELLERADRLSALLAEKDQTLVSLVDQSSAILDMVSRRRGEIASGIESGAATVDELARLVDVNKARLDSILSTVHPTVEILDRRRADLDRALTWLGPGALGLGMATTYGPWEEIYVRMIGPDLLGVIERTLGTGAEGNP